MQYDTYKYSVKEFIKYSVMGILTVSCFSFFFYRSFTAFAIGLPGIYIFLRVTKKELIETRKKILSDQFSETLFSIAANMNAGYSMENAVCESLKDIVRFYGEDSYMAREITMIRQGLSVNVTLEDLITDLGRRSGVEDIITFSEVLKTAKRNGGNIISVMYETAGTIREKLRIANDIEVVISEKKFELKIMEAVPFFIILYVGVTSPGYFDELYHNPFGTVFMTVCMGCYFLAVFLGRKIIDIKI